MLYYYTKIYYKKIMDIKNIFEDNRSQSIESLEFFFFLEEIYFSLLKDNFKRCIFENSLIQN